MSQAQSGHEYVQWWQYANFVRPSL